MPIERASKVVGCPPHASLSMVVWVSQFSSNLLPGRSSGLLQTWQ